MASISPSSARASLRIMWSAKSSASPATRAFRSRCRFRSIRVRRQQKPSRVLPPSGRKPDRWCPSRSRPLPRKNCSAAVAPLPLPPPTQPSTGPSRRARRSRPRAVGPTISAGRVARSKSGPARSSRRRLTLRRRMPAPNPPSLPSARRRWMPTLRSTSRPSAGRAHIDSDAQMRVLELIPLALLAITAVVFSTHVCSAQAREPECTQLLNLPDDGAPLAVSLQTLASANIDRSQAESVCRSALRADPANPASLFQLGRALSLGSKRLEAIKYYLAAADRGHAGAMNDLGGVFEYGIGVPKNFATALVWYERAAESGHAGAMAHLGQLSEDGFDVPQDLANARHWYEKAAAVGNATSMNNLANLFRYGRGAVPNLPAA